MSTKRIVVLGGGTGGTMVANRLRRHFDADEAEIHVVDRDDAHVYQPGLLFVPFGLADADEIVRPRRRQFRDGIAFHENEVVEVGLGGTRFCSTTERFFPTTFSSSPAARSSSPRKQRGSPVQAGTSVSSRSTPRTAPLPCVRRWSVSTGPPGREPRRHADQVPGRAARVCVPRRLVPARARIRNRVELVYSTPLDGAFTKPVASRELAGLLGEKEIELVTEFNAGEVDGVGGKLVSYDGRELDFDLLVTVPLHGGAAYVERSPGLGDALGFVPTDKHTLQTPSSPNVSHSATRPICRPRRPDPSLTSRPRSWRRTSFATWPERSSSPGTTGTPTASSRPASTRRC